MPECYQELNRKLYVSMVQSVNDHMLAQAQSDQGLEGGGGGGVLVSNHRLNFRTFTNYASVTMTLSITMNVQFTKLMLISSVFLIHTLYSGKFTDHTKPFPDPV